MNDLETRFAVHEAVCEERAKHISDSLDKGSARMQRIEMLLYGVIILVMLGPGAAAEFIKKFFG
jgi:predicted nucleic acid-binding Zn ribbon protein